MWVSAPSPLPVLDISGFRSDPDGPAGAAFVEALRDAFHGIGAAYLVGRRLGRHRMSPYISPKKSCEGAVGGVLGAMAWAVAAVPLLGLPVGLAAAALLGLSAIFGTDLPTHEGFRAAVAEAHHRLLTAGARAAAAG